MARGEHPMSPDGSSPNHDVVDCLVPLLFYDTDNSLLNIL